MEPRAKLKRLARQILRFRLGVQGVRDNCREAACRVVTIHFYSCVRFLILNESWQSKHSATVVRLDSLFAHSVGLPCRNIRDYQAGWTLQQGGASSWSEGGERLTCLHPLITSVDRPKRYGNQ